MITIVVLEEDQNLHQNDRLEHEGVNPHLVLSSSNVVVVFFAGVYGQHTHQEGSERVYVVSWGDIQHEFVEEEGEVHQWHLG